MGKIGRLGDITFEASETMIRTLSNMKWSGSARYATHQRHGGNALTEFVGLGTDMFSFSITLSRELGVEPMDEIKKLWKYERAGEAVPLNIGGHAYGRYRWGDGSPPSCGGAGRPRYPKRSPLAT